MQRLEKFVARLPEAERWRQVEEWARTSYSLVAPKKLAQLVLDEDAAVS